jgi:malate dehydrogenase (oxaloacetate-decarboxylating)(NADP+)
VPADLLHQGLLYPLQSSVLETEIQTAARIAKLIFDSGLARVKRPADIVAFFVSMFTSRSTGQNQPWWSQ